MQLCRYCRESFTDFGELARHIMTEKRGHRAGKKWAASYLTKVDLLNQKRDRPERAPLTEAEKASRAEARSELSGVESRVLTVCPKCNARNYQELPAEFARSPRAWRNPNGALFIMCHNCK